MSLKKILAFISISLVLSTGALAKSPRFKDGRQYAIELARNLNIPQSELVKVFNENRVNTPKNGDLSSVTSGLDTLTKIAAVACNYAGLFDEGKVSIVGQYKQILDREPTPAEISNAINNPDGSYSYFANCLYLALTPEFLSVK